MGDFIELKIRTVNGKEHVVEYSKTSKEIKLGKNGIVIIDLTPLQFLADLEVLEIGAPNIVDFVEAIRSHEGLSPLLPSLGDNQLKNVDLSPLATCEKLRVLYLGHNNLESIDLTPLQSCPNLKGLILRDNKLQNIDLTPLSSCTELTLLDLQENELKSIDLTPLDSLPKLNSIHLNENQLESVKLASFPELRELNLRDNKIQSIDFSPLKTCNNLREIALHSNQLKSIDLTPLRFCPGSWSLKIGKNEFSNSIDLTPLFRNSELVVSSGHSMSSWLQPTLEHTHPAPVYSRPTMLYSWDFLYDVASEFKNDYRVQHDILGALGLSDYGFIDCDLTDTLLSIPPETSTDEAQKIVTKKLLDEIITSVEERRQTTGLNLEVLINKHSEIASMVKDIKELRKREIEHVRIPVLEHNAVDIRELWVTAYGYEVLKDLIPLKKYSRGIAEQPLHQQIEQSLTKLGVQLKTGETKQSGVQMSKKLRECIWLIVQLEDNFWDLFDTTERIVKSWFS